MYPFQRQHLRQCSVFFLTFTVVGSILSSFDTDPGIIPIGDIWKILNQIIFMPLWSLYFSLSYTTRYIISLDSLWV